MLAVVARMPDICFRMRITEHSVTVVRCCCVPMDTCIRLAAVKIKTIMLQSASIIMLTCDCASGIWFVTVFIMDLVRFDAMFSDAYVFVRSRDCLRVFVL